MKIRILRTPGKSLELPYKEGQIVDCPDAEAQALIQRRPPLAEPAEEKPKKTEAEAKPKPEAKPEAKTESKKS